MRIADKHITIGQPVFIIAEIGMNHDGNKDKAIKLIEMAAESGVDAVKFQSFRATDIINPTLPADYDPQEPVPDEYEFFHQYLAQYELPYEWHDDLIKRCNELGVLFLSTPCSLEAVAFLAPRVPAFKVASMDLTNKDLLEAIGKQRKPVILSTGIGTLGEIECALDTLRANGASDVAVLHCVADYPPKPKDLNLNNIPMLRQAFGLEVGFSDHSLGISSAIASVALGAVIIEKHITLSRDTPGPDHYFALEPADLKALVSGIREVEDAMGKAQRRLTPSERPKQKTYRRSLLASRALPAGHVVQREDLVLIRPGDGVAPYDMDKVLGLALKTPLEAFQPLRWEHFKEA